VLPAQSAPPQGHPPETDLSVRIRKFSWFLAFNAHVELHPCMNLEDLKKATPGIERAVKNFRSTHKKAA
jgi:hypothetical protein